MKLSKCIISGLLIFLVAGCQNVGAKASYVCIKDNCYEVEIAENNADRQRGLMFREHLAEDKGMLFVFERSFAYKFWMRNTLIPLDIIWIDESYKIIYISKNTPPCQKDPCPQYGPNEQALFVLELKGGTAHKHGINVSDICEFKLNR